MNIGKLAGSFAARLSLGSQSAPSEGIADFAFEKTGDFRSDIREKYGFDGLLLELFTGNKGSLIHKWPHYIPLYERYFSAFRPSWPPSSRRWAAST
ncbi:MAG: hypothetical protein ACRETB_11865 [Steroidobacteraceae bacterium]